MIDVGVLNTYERNSVFRSYTIDKVEGYDKIELEIVDYPIKGTLVSYTTGWSRGGLFIADKPLVDTSSTTEDGYLLHSGIFKEGYMDGRCYFVSIKSKTSGKIFTKYKGVFDMLNIKGLKV